jgi:protein-S-isoprenylcysteine O-methyltransferase Ste14
MNRHGASRGPGIRCYAPVVFATVFAAGWLLNHTWHLPIAVAGSGNVRIAAGWLLSVAGVLLSVLSIATLVRAKTTFMPDRESNRLIVGGPFSISRNPIYVGMLAIYVGMTLLANTAWPILLLPVVWIWMRVGIINREERYLAEKFGEPYAEYRRRVRRWL